MLVFFVKCKSLTTAATTTTAKCVCDSTGGKGGLKSSILLQVIGFNKSRWQGLKRGAVLLQ